MTTKFRVRPVMTASISLRRSCSERNEWNRIYYIIDRGKMQAFFEKNSPNFENPCPSSNSTVSRADFLEILHPENQGDTPKEGV